MLTKEQRDYAEEYIRGAWDQYQNSRNRYFYNDRDSISTIRQYMNGSLDGIRYQNIVIPQELANEDDTWVNINWKPLDIYSKYRRIVIQLVMAMKEDISIDVIDSMAVDERQEFFSEVASQIIMREKLAEQGVSPEEVGLDPELPEDMKELEMFMEFDYKSMASIEFETVLSLLMDRNDWDKETYKRLIEDVHDIGVSITRDIEESDGELIAEYVDPEFFFSSYVEDKSFKNMEFAGQVKRMTISDILNMDMEESEKKKVLDVQELMDHTHPDTAYFKEKKDKLRDHQDLDSSFLNCIYLEWISGESEEYEIRETKDGRKVFGYRSNGNKNKEFETAHFDCVYEGYHILGTDAFFQVRKKEFVLRDPDDIRKAMLTYRPHAPEMNHMNINSMGRQVMSTIDAINIAWFKLQNAIIKAKPSGVAYDLTSLESVPFGESGMTPEENILNYGVTGNLAIRLVDEDGKFTRMPIQELDGGIGQQGKDFREELAANENQFRSITGLNEIVDGSTPNPKTLKSVAQAAMVASNNAIKHIHDSCQSQELKMSKALIMRVQDQAETEDVEFYAPALGSNTVRFLKMTKDHSARSLGLSFVAKPTQEEDQNFEQALQIALGTPEGGRAQITIAQAAKLREIRNKKYAMMYLGYIVEKNLEKAEQRENEKMMQQGEINKEVALATEEEKRKTLEQEKQVKAFLIDKQGQWDFEIKKMEVTGKVNEQQINADARDRESERMNETKIGIEEMKKKQEIEAQKQKEAEQDQKSKDK